MEISPRNAIKELEKKGLSHASLAAALGVNQGTVSRLLNGKTKSIKHATWIRLSKLYSSVLGAGGKRAVRQKDLNKE